MRPFLSCKFVFCAESSPEVRGLQPRFYRTQIIIFFCVFVVFFVFRKHFEKKKLSCPHEKSVEIPPPIPLQEGVTSPVCPSCGPPATRVQENAGV